MTLANAHALFCGLKKDPSYLANLTVPEDVIESLLLARKDIRAVLRDNAVNLRFDSHFWVSDSIYSSSQSARPNISMKFMTQGSYVYGTLNSPEKPQVQEIDLDDGMYVPVDFLSDGKPALIAKSLFDFVLTTLNDNGWSAQSKPNCVRVRLSRGAHIDIPIYSIPRNEFESLAIATENANMQSSQLFRDSLGTINRLPSDKVMLARADGTWI